MARISNVYRMVITALLASLGFSCPFYGVEEYGTPHATYKAKGVVVSEADNSPIQGIRASLLRYYSYDDEPFSYPIATAYTDNEGFFFLRGGESSRRLKLFVELLDVDGEANGSFARLEIEADYSNKTFTGSSGNWNLGEAEINLGTIKMKPE